MSYTIEVIAEIDYSEEVKTAVYVQKLPNIQNQIDDELITQLDDIVASILTNIKTYKFILNNHYQSKKGYSYYINFTPIYENKPLVDVDLIFRVSDHKSPSAVEGLNKTAFIKSFILNGANVDNSLYLILKLNEIFDQLSKGDISALVEK